jgi:DNA-binding transcriptional LysR family regulator
MSSMQNCIAKSTDMPTHDAPMPGLDWTALRLFLVAAEQGSMAGAARQLGLSQPTLSRQIAALEEAMGLALFERTQRGLRLTAAGQALRAPVERMRDAARDVALGAAGRDLSTAGTVRLTASEVVSAFLLPPVLAGLRQTHPEIQIELLPSDQVEDLLDRRADIALRMVRPTQPGLLARKLGDWPLGLYASPAYLERRGQPQIGTLKDHDWIGLDRSTQFIDGFAQAGIQVDRGFFAWRCDHQVVNWHAVRAGLGLGVGLQRVAAGDPLVQRVLPELPLPTLPVWLTAHRELRATPRLSRVFDALVEAFSAP